MNRILEPKLATPSTGAIRNPTDGLFCKSKRPVVATKQGVPEVHWLNCHDKEKCSHASAHWLKEQASTAKRFFASCHDLIVMHVPVLRMSAWHNAVKRTSGVEELSYVSMPDGSGGRIIYSNQHVRGFKRGSRKFSKFSTHRDYTLGAALSTFKAHLSGLLDSKGMIGRRVVFAGAWKLSKDKLRTAQARALAKMNEYKYLGKANTQITQDDAAQAEGDYRVHKCVESFGIQVGLIPFNSSPDKRIKVYRHKQTLKKQRLNIIDQARADLESFIRRMS